MEHRTDILDPARANACAASLGLSTRLQAGDPLPPFFHQLYFWQAEPPEALGRDGHPAKGSALIPDFGLPRRMWAGGRLAFHEPLIAGQSAEKQTTLHTAKQKQGRTGPLAFVTLRHDILQDGALKLTEYQDLVYREDASPDAPASLSMVIAFITTKHMLAMSSTTQVSLFTGHCSLNVLCSWPRSTSVRSKSSLSAPALH